MLDPLEILLTISIASVVGLLVLIFLPHTKHLNRATAVCSITLLLGAISMLYLATVEVIATQSLLTGISFGLIFLGAVGYVLSLIDLILPTLDWSKVVRVALPLIVVGIVGLIMTTL